MILKQHKQQQQQQVMNLDEFLLRNVMPVEEPELVHNHPSSSSLARDTSSLFHGKTTEDDVDPQPNRTNEVLADAPGMDWMDYQLTHSKLPVSQGVYDLHATSMPTSASDFLEGSGGRKRKQGDDVREKTIERRQRRMIKNRESAARSRARKQEIERLFLSKPIPMPRYQLRRTSSAFF